MFLLVRLAPSEVLNVIFVHDGTNFNVSWDKPLQPNGNLNYIIVLTGTNLLRNNQILSTTGVVTDLEFIIESPSVPYTLYMASVLPQTGGGAGPESNATLMTDQKGNNCI